MNDQGINKSLLPLGIKLIWVNQAFSLTGLILSTFDKPTPIIVGPWVMPMLISNVYLAFMIISQICIVMDLLKLKYSAWQLLLAIQTLALVILIADFFISPETLNLINASMKINLSMTVYRATLIPAIAIQGAILAYLLQRKNLFTQ